MLKLVSVTESPLRSSEFRKGFQDALKRIAGACAGKRSKEELTAMIMVLEWAVADLKFLLKQLHQEESRLKIVK